MWWSFFLKDKGGQETRYNLTKCNYQTPSRDKSTLVSLGVTSEDYDSLEIVSNIAVLGVELRASHVLDKHRTCQDVHVVLEIVTLLFQAPEELWLQACSIMPSSGCKLFMCALLNKPQWSATQKESVSCHLTDWTKALLFTMACRSWWCVLTDI